MLGLKRSIFGLLSGLISFLLLYTTTSPASSADTSQVYLPLVFRADVPACVKITSDTTWKATGSPYLISCDVYVEPKVTLTIEAGVTVQFEHPGDDLLIGGTLQAIGTPPAFIRFQPLNGATPGSWGRVEFMLGSSGVLDHTLLEYGGSSDGMVYIASDAVQMVNSVVQYSADTGIYIQDASPLISATQIMTNTGSDGCGLYNDTGSPKIQNNTFSGNYSRTDFEITYGGGLYNGSGSPDIQSNTFSGNLSSHGSGLFNGSGSPNIQNNSFNSNGTNLEIYSLWPRQGYGGGMYNDSGSPVIQKNTFSSNTAFGWVNVKFGGNGGGLFNNIGSPILTNNTFVGNYAGGRGGGMYSSSGNPTVEFSVFAGNDVIAYSACGGGMFIRAGSPIIRNNIFTGNLVSGIDTCGGGLASYGDDLVQNNIFNDNLLNGGGAYGGGVYAGGNSIIQNNTFIGNVSARGGGLAVNSGVNVNLTSNIVVSNTSGSGGGVYSATGFAALDYNDVWNNTGGDYYNVTPGAHDISIDPLLVDPVNGDFHLSPGSPCIDAGDPINFPPTDFEGNPRPYGPAPDIGADEYYPTGVVKTIIVWWILYINPGGVRW